MEREINYNKEYLKNVLNSKNDFQNQITGESNYEYHEDLNIQFDDDNYKNYLLQENFNYEGEFESYLCNPIDVNKAHLEIFKLNNSKDFLDPHKTSGTSIKKDSSKNLEKSIIESINNEINFNSDWLLNQRRLEKNKSQVNNFLELKENINIKNKKHKAKVEQIKFKDSVSSDGASILNNSSQSMKISDDKNLKNNIKSLKILEQMKSKKLSERKNLLDDSLSNLIAKTKEEIKIEKNRLAVKKNRDKMKSKIHELEIYNSKLVIENNRLHEKSEILEKNLIKINCYLNRNLCNTCNDKYEKFSYSINSHYMQLCDGVSSIDNEIGDKYDSRSSSIIYKPNNNNLDNHKLTVNLTENTSKDNSTISTNESLSINKLSNSYDDIKYGLNLPYYFKPLIIITIILILFTSVLLFLGKTKNSEINSLKVLNLKEDNINKKFLINGNNTNLHSFIDEKNSRFYNSSFESEILKSSENNFELYYILKKQENDIFTFFDKDFIFKYKKNDFSIIEEYNNIQSNYFEEINGENKNKNTLLEESFSSKNSANLNPSKYNQLVPINYKFIESENEDTITVKYLTEFLKNSIVFEDLKKFSEYENDNLMIFFNNGSNSNSTLICLNKLKQIYNNLDRFNVKKNIKEVNETKKQNEKSNITTIITTDKNHTLSIDDV